MLILGFDPGTATTGWGLLQVISEQCTVNSWGIIETSKDDQKENRLQKIYEETLALINLHKPDIFVFEKVFFATNAKTAIAVGQAQGVMLLAASKAKVKVEEYAPGTIKKMMYNES